MTAFYYQCSVQNRRRLKIQDWGESYTTDCVFCNDTRRRMSVSHRWGIHDRETDDRGYSLWRCYNTDCQDDYRSRRALRDMLEMSLGGAVFRTPPVVNPREAITRTFDGRFVPLSQVPIDHKAVEYLRDVRKFDIDYLCKVWGVGVVTDLPTGCAMLYDGHIVIPVLEKGVPVGWQTRIPFDVSKSSAVRIAKYLTFFPKSKYLYGYDQSAYATVLAVIEGATDAWRYGPGAVGGFGNKLSPDQIQKMVELAQGRPIVFVPDANDPQALKKAVRSAEEIRAAGSTSPIGVVGLPTGTDPGGTDSRLLRAAVEYAAAHPVFV